MKLAVTRALACLLLAVPALGACGRADTLAGNTSESSIGPGSPDSPVSTSVSEPPGSQPAADEPPSGTPDGGATAVQPDPTAQSPTQVPIQGATVTVDGRRVTARLVWWAGVAPCHVLQRVDVSVDGRTVHVSVWIGTKDPSAACIEIAQQYETDVDVGVLEPGSWTLRWGELPEDRVDFTV